jgi:transposase
MRGKAKNQPTMLMVMSPGSMVPPSHPLRGIKKLADAALKDLDPVFAGMYAEAGRHSIPPERLLKALLLMVLYSVRSERQLCEQLQYNMLFRWFVDMDMTEPAFEHSTFSKNRERLVEHEVAVAFLAAVVELAKAAGLMSGEHFSVDGTLIAALASHKSIKPKDTDPKDPPDTGATASKTSADSGPTDPKGRSDSNGWSSFKGEKRSNATHASTTDPDARIARKSSGTGAELSYAVNALMDNRHGLIADVRTDIVTGTIERDAALEMLGQIDGERRATVGADKAYDTKGFVKGCRERGVSPHVAQNIQPGRRGSAIDKRTTRHEGYKISLIVRRQIEAAFAWFKAPGRMKRARYRGIDRVGWFTSLTAAVFNLVKINNIARA